VPASHSIPQVSLPASSSATLPDSTIASQRHAVRLRTVLVKEWSAEGKTLRDMPGRQQ
jgi:hypothetical protein